MVLARAKRHVLMVGNTGTGKTACMQAIMQTMPDNYATLLINFSAQTSSKKVQDIIEGKMEKKSKKSYAPPGGKRLLCCIEDMNMPAKDLFFSQPTLELLRLWMDQGYWYDREKQSKRQINEMQLLGTMTSGRQMINPRIQSKFHVLNVTFPSDLQIKKIFTLILKTKLAQIEEFEPMIELFVQATVEVYNEVIKVMLPTPSKSHYLFNMRDMSKVFQGLMQTKHELLETKEQLIVIWAHECLRTFSDRLNDMNDKQWFRDQLGNKLAEKFALKWSQLTKDGVNPIVVDFLDPNEDDPFYAEVLDTPGLKKHIENKMVEYNEEPGYRALDLVFFVDAIDHLCRIHRIIRQPRGNALLVGVGGSGRQSQTRMATYLAGYTCFSIEVTKSYRSADFHEDLKKLYLSCGRDKQRKTFLFSDTQIVEPSFLEDINGMLGSGEVANLFAADEMAAIREDLRADAIAARIQDTLENVYQFFIDRARERLHIVVCMSPVGSQFRVRLRMFPTLVNNTSIDWFTEWPPEALQEVSMKFLTEIEVEGGEEMQHALSEAFVVCHTSVASASLRMKEDLRRSNYVTPTNYLELVQGYIKILHAKHQELGEQCDKLQGGLSKLEETKISVQKMSEDLVEAKSLLTQAEADCDALLQVITQEKRVADEKRVQVEADKIKISREKEVANAIAAEAQADLDKAMPELDAAQEALKTLKKAEIDEIKAYKTPPEAVQTVLSAVQTVLKKPPTWDEAKKTMGDSQFLPGLMDFNKELLNDALLTKIGKYTANPKFKPELVGKVSNAAKGLCLWVIAMHRFGIVQKEVMPKKMKLDKATEELARKEKMLADALAVLQEMTEKVEALEKQTNEKLTEKKKLQDDAEATQAKLTRAEEIVGGLGGEKDRWTESIKKYEAAILNLTGDSLLASAFLSYAGPFNSEYRMELVEKLWMKEVRRLNIPVTRGFVPTDFLSEPTDVREWQLQGLPGDDFSVENGVLVNRGSRWPLMIDPQGQANKWIKSMEKSRGLKVLDLKMADFLRSIEHAVQLGTPVLMQDVLEEMDPSLDPILSKAIMKQGSRMVMKIGDNTVDYNEKFRFYLTTKLANPHYSPEVCTKALVINFAVREDGLEDQLLKIVVRKEKAELEEQKDELVLNTAAAKKKTKELEDEILRILANSDDSLLEDVNLVTTLKTSKETSVAIQKQLKDAEVTEEKINVAREAYRPCAKRASILFFVLSDLGSIDNMYQFSLDAYVTLFTLSIVKSAENIRSDSVQTRVKTLNDWHTLAVYNNTCRGLFEKHKLLFSFHMAARILAARNELNIEEYAFFLKGGQVFDKDSQAPNPCPQWLSEKGWDNVYELDKLLAFHGISSSFEQGPSQWLEIYLSPNPEDAELPGDWQTKFDDLQRMIMIRCIRPDRVIFMVTRYIEKYLDKKYVEPPSFNLQEIYDDSNPFQPLIFVLCPGVDPTSQLLGLADKLGRNLKALALGQGQAPLATRLMAEQAKTGGWVFLANCHLMLSWLPKLEKIIDDLPAQKPHDNFRLWLSSTPHEKFPIAILQMGIKMTTEPPTGLKSNLVRLYNLLTDSRFNKPKYPELYRPLLFSLCFYHSVLLERRKFGALGMAIPYDFNDSDWEVSENILQLYLDEMPDGAVTSIPWDTIRYLICDASYGGRVTDDWDRRTLSVYVCQYFHPDAVTIQQHKLSKHDEYMIPCMDGTIAAYKEYISTLPVIDPPQAFGQHPNADISSQITNSMALLETLIAINASLLRSVAGGGGGGGGGGEGGSAANSVETRVYNMATDLEERLPEIVDLDQIIESKAEEAGNALLTVLLQELDRYNGLLKRVFSSLNQLKKGVKGLVVMNDELEDIYGALLDGRVPKVWLKTYPSLKPLASWARDLIARVEQLSTWGMGSQPKTFWLSGFTYPTGFLKALQQVQARATKISIDKFGWEYHVLPAEMGTVTQSPKEGAYIRGMYLEGASWHDERGCVAEPNPMELISQMPLVHFKPVEVKKKAAKGMYVAPLYMYPIRTGSRERPSFVVGVDLPTGAYDPAEWVKRGTALLLATDT
uniref:Dynein heavy chain n=1 Tax=Eutreptiella gymnastica TaxID=73025 RepID=A0A7S1IC30_9EUGL